MKLEIREADRSDLMKLLDFYSEDGEINDERAREHFDSVLTQTGHTVLLAETQSGLSGVLCVSVIDGIGKKFPVAVLCGGKLCDSSDETVRGALLSKAEEIARKNGCVRMTW